MAVNLIFICLSSLYSTVAGSVFYDYLGCYGDSLSVPDVSGTVSVLNQLSPVACVTQCINVGYPFAGLQDGSTCYCGLSYGKYGRLDPSICNETCGVNEDRCGGRSANSIYYAVNFDAAVIQKRGLAVITTDRTYSDARRACIKTDGDLAAINSLELVNQTLHLISQTHGASGSNYWIGLSRQQATESYQWNYLAVNKIFAMSDFAQYWIDGEQYQNDCVSIIAKTGKWQSRPCTDQLPSICITSSTLNTNQINNDDSTESLDYVTVADSNSMGNNSLVLYLVLSFVMASFLSSCIAYGIYKLRRGEKKTAKNKPTLMTSSITNNNNEKPIPVPNCVLTPSGQLDSQTIVKYPQEIIHKTNPGATDHRPQFLAMPSVERTDDDAPSTSRHLRSPSPLTARDVDLFENNTSINEQPRRLSEDQTRTPLKRNNKVVPMERANSHDLNESSKIQLERQRTSSETKLLAPPDLGSLDSESRRPSVRSENEAELFPRTNRRNSLAVERSNAERRNSRRASLFPKSLDVPTDLARRNSVLPKPKKKPKRIIFVD